MRLTIDTNADSKEDIQKAINLLSSLVNHQTEDSNIWTNAEPKQKDIFESDEPLRNLVTMFDAAEPKKEITSSLRSEVKKNSMLPPIMEIY